MTNEPKRCGNCRWWELQSTIHQLGDCTHPIPDCVPLGEVDTDSMYADDGTTCPCHERKEKSE